MRNEGSFVRHVRLSRLHYWHRGTSASRPKGRVLPVTRQLRAGIFLVSQPFCMQYGSRASGRAHLQRVVGRFRKHVHELSLECRQGQQEVL
jgi:hypothetical protein